LNGLVIDAVELDSLKGSSRAACEGRSRGELS
jgi:hypothetical protein